MCGIIAAVSTHDIVPLLLDGLSRLEYRGYDSAGLAVIDGGLRRTRISGRVHALRQRVEQDGMHGLTGIAHTRWATHGAPTEANAHPHFSGDLIAVVHNGIIENHAALRAALEGGGYRFSSETDTEVIAHLVHRTYADNGGDLVEAVRRAATLLDGSYAIAVMAANRSGQLVCARRGSPLVVGIRDDSRLVASDVYALLPFTDRYFHLEDGDVLELAADRHRCFDSDGHPVERPVQVSTLAARDADLGGYRHFMAKEIHEQPHVLGDTLADLSPAFDPEPFGRDAARLLADTQRIAIVACGTSYHAGQVARHWIENRADLPCTVDVASEFRYREGHFDGRGLLVIVISQSGETADTLGALHYARKRGAAHALAICNVPESSLTRQSDLHFITRAGPEIGVASTKAFTTQLASLYALAATLARLRGRLGKDEARALHHRLARLPEWVDEALRQESRIATLAEDFAAQDHALYIGRGLNLPVAMEGALKLKEISYIHAEACPAGELKHGPLALVDSKMPVVALAPADAQLEKMKSNMQEVRARHGRLYIFSDRASDLPPEAVSIVLPGGYGDLAPVPYVVLMQLLAYHTAVRRGTDVDKPRNLAKSVTVE